MEDALYRKDVLPGRMVLREDFFFGGGEGNDFRRGCFFKFSNTVYILSRGAKGYLPRADWLYKLPADS